MLDAILNHFPHYFFETGSLIETAGCKQLDRVGGGQ